MERKPYAVVRSVQDLKGKEIEKQDISCHDMYHQACEALRQTLFQELQKAYKVSKGDIFDSDGNLKTNSPYLKEWINECCPYRWRIGIKRKIIVYEVVRRTY